jgi:hypothetical protein
MEFPVHRGSYSGIDLGSTGSGIDPSILLHRIVSSVFRNKRDRRRGVYRDLKNEEGRMW